MSKETKGIQVTYRLLVSRSARRPQAELYPFGLQDPIPPFQLPLRHGDTEPLVDLQALLQGVYDRAGFDLASSPIPVIQSHRCRKPMQTAQMLCCNKLSANSRMTSSDQAHQRQIT